MARKGSQHKNKNPDLAHSNSDLKKHEIKRNRSAGPISDSSIECGKHETLNSPEQIDISTKLEENCSSETSENKKLSEQEEKNDGTAAQILLQKAASTLKFYIICVIAEVKGWADKLKPHVTKLMITLKKRYNYIKEKFDVYFPQVKQSVVKAGKIVMVLFMVWLDCTIRGVDSLLRVGTASFFVLILCSFLSIGAMVGIKLMLLLVVINACLAVFVSLAIGLILVAISSAVALWLYGSFWTTILVILFGGASLALRHERIALFVATIYSMYCAKSYLGWIGLAVALNLSFISSDIILHLLKRIDERKYQRATKASFVQDQDQDGTFPFVQQRPTDRGPGEPSTSGQETEELTSEEEIVRLLNCTDHYSVWGLPRRGEIDATWLKREYRKKAMLVHPDKNIGNEKAAEAFKKLQNAYEVLLDSVKRKTYDDELKREELLNYFQSFQAASSQKRSRNGIFGFGPGRPEGDNIPSGDLRRIVCKKCGDSHIWICTDRSKAKARWCQDCQEFHQARDGDGWLEQSTQPLLFGLLHKMDTPCAYVCADSKIYDVTDWFICQGMRCPANTHKPSFHVNASITKSNSKGSTSNHRGQGPGPGNMEEEMTEEEFFQWLQNAVDAGAFDPFVSPNDATTAGNPSASKSGSSNSSGKKKRKGKKQW